MTASSREAEQEAARDLAVRADGRQRITGGLLARNTFANVLGQAVPVLVAAAALPLLARGLGAERLGLLSLAWTILTLFGDLGFGRAATKLAADALARREPQRLGAIAWGTAALQAAIGVIAGGAMALTVPLVVGRVLHLPVGLAAEAQAGFLWLAIGLPAVVMATAFRGLLEAGQHFVLLNVVRVPLATATFFLPLLALPFGWGFPGIVLLLLGARLVSLVVFFVLGARFYPSLLRPRGFREEFPAVAHFGAWATVSTVVSPLLVYLDRFILSAIAGVAALAYYTPPMELAMRLLVIPGSATLTLFPAFTTLFAQEQREHLHRLVAQAVKYVLLGLGPLLVLLLVGAPDILRLWLGKDFELHGALALQILAAGVGVNALGYLFFALVQGVGRPDLTARFHLIELPVYAVAAWLLIRGWGIPGAALAWSLRVTADTSLLFIAALRASAASARVMAAERVTRTIGLLVFFWALAAAAVRPFDSPVGRLCMLGALSVVLVGGLWQFTLGAGERAWVSRSLGLARAREP